MIFILDYLQKMSQNEDLDGDEANSASSKCERGTFLNEMQYTLFKNFLKYGVRPTIQELIDNLNVDHHGVSVTNNFSKLRERLRFKFRSWAARMEYRESDDNLIHKLYRKIIIPKEMYTSVIMDIHCNCFKHLGITATFARITHKYSTGKRNFGMLEEDVRETIRKCTDPGCTNNRKKNPHQKFPYCHDLSSAIVLKKSKKLAKKTQKASHKNSSSTESSEENSNQIQADEGDSVYIPRHRFDQLHPGEVQNDPKETDINQVSLSHKNKIFTSDLNELFSIPSKSIKKLSTKKSDQNDVEMVQGDSDENNNDPHLNHQSEEKDEEDDDVICLDDLYTNGFSNNKTTIDDSRSEHKEDGAASSDTAKIHSKTVHAELNTLTVVNLEVANFGESECLQLPANDNSKKSKRKVTANSVKNSEVTNDGESQELPVNKNSKKSKRKVTAISATSVQESSTNEIQIIKSPEVKNHDVITSALGDHSQADLSSVRKITPAFANPNQFQLRFILPGVHTPVVPSKILMTNTFQEEPRPLVPSLIMPPPNIGHPDDAIDLSVQPTDQCKTTFPGSIINLNTQPPVVQTGQSNQSSHFLPGSFLNYNTSPFAFPQNVLPTISNFNNFQNIQPPFGSSQIIGNVENSNKSQFQQSTNIASSKPELMRLLCQPPANQINSSSSVGCVQQLGQPIQNGGIPTNLTTPGIIPSVFLATGTNVSSAPVSTTGTGISSIIQGNTIQQPNQPGVTNVLPLDTTLQNQLSYCFLPVVNADGSQGIVPCAILPKPPTNPILPTSMPGLMNTTQSAPMNTLPTLVTSLSHTSQSAPTNRLPTPVKSLVSDTFKSPSTSVLDESPVDDVIKSFYGNSVVKTSSFETKTTPTVCTVAGGSPTVQVQHTTTSTMKTPEILNVSTISETNWKAAHTSTEKQKIQTRSRSGRNGLASKRLREKLTKKINEKEERSSKNLRKLKDYVEENNKMKIRKLLMKEKSQKVRDVLLKALKKFDDNCNRKQKKAKLSAAEDASKITDPEYHELCEEEVNHENHNELISADYLSGIRGEQMTKDEGEEDNGENTKVGRARGVIYNNTSANILGMMSCVLPPESVAATALPLVNTFGTQEHINGKAHQSNDVHKNRKLGPPPYPNIWHHYDDVSEETSSFKRLVHVIHDMKMDIMRSTVRDTTATERLKKKISYGEDLIQHFKSMTR